MYIYIVCNIYVSPARCMHAALARQLACPLCLLLVAPWAVQCKNSTAGHLTNLDSQVEWRCPSPSQHTRHRFHISYSHVAIYLLML